MNELPRPLLQGTFGELLVQLRLLEHSVQASPPIRDTGNDLIGIRGSVFRAVQVKTTADFPVKFDTAKLPPRFHILAIVVLGEVKYDDLIDFETKLDTCRIFLLKEKDVTKGYWTKDDLQDSELSKQRVDALWPRPE